MIASQTGIATEESESPYSNRYEEVGKICTAEDGLVSKGRKDRRRLRLQVTGV